MLDLLQEASQLAGRDIEIEETTDGKYIVLYMSFSGSPPPKGDTEIDALEKFIDTMKKRRTHGNNIEPIGESDSPDSGIQGADQSEERGRGGPDL